MNLHEQDVENFSQKATFMSEMQSRRFTYCSHNTLFAIDLIAVENALESLVNHPSHLIVTPHRLIFIIVELEHLTVDFRSLHVTFKSKLSWLELTDIVGKKVLSFEHVADCHCSGSDVDWHADAGNKLTEYKQHSNKSARLMCNSNFDVQGWNSPDDASDFLLERSKIASRDCSWRTHGCWIWKQWRAKWTWTCLKWDWRRFFEMKYAMAEIVEEVEERNSFVKFHNTTR